MRLWVISFLKPHLSKAMRDLKMEIIKRISGGLIMKCKDCVCFVLDTTSIYGDGERAFRELHGYDREYFKCKINSGMVTEDHWCCIESEINELKPVLKLLNRDLKLRDRLNKNRENNPDKNK